MGAVVMWKGQKLGLHQQLLACVQRSQKDHACKVNGDSDQIEALWCADPASPSVCQPKLPTITTNADPR